MFYAEIASSDVKMKNLNDCGKAKLNFASLSNIRFRRPHFVLKYINIKLLNITHADSREFKERKLMRKRPLRGTKRT